LDNHRISFAYDSAEIIIKALVILGIVIVTISVILFLGNVVPKHPHSGYVQAMIAGAVIILMALVSKKIFSLELLR